MHRAAQWLDQHRTHTLVALVLAGVAAAGLIAGVLLDLAGGGSEPPQPPRPNAAARQVFPATASADPSPEQPTRPADSEIEPGRRDDVGYFLDASLEADGVHVTFDRVQFLTGDAAAAFAEKQDQPLPTSGVLVVNENPRTREVVLSPEIVVFGRGQLAGTSDLQEIALTQLLAALADKGRTTVLDVTYDDLGYVTEVKEKQLS